MRPGPDRPIRGAGASQSTEVLDEQVTVALARCERRAGGDRWEPAPSTDCGDRFGAAVGPTPPFLDPDTAARCELPDPTECLLPWPSDHLTAADPTTDTDGDGPSTRHRCPATGTASPSIPLTSTAATASAPAR